MKCEFCELARECTDPARFGGGCDIDGADDFGCNGGDCIRAKLCAEPCAGCPYCDEEGNL